MTSNPFQEKRTRSQVKLSDDILKVPEQSPLKNARNAARKNPEFPTDLQSTDYNDSQLQSLLDKPSGSKRSVSPPLRDEYRTGIEGMKHEREFKRMKWDPGYEKIKNAEAPILNPIHARTNSEPNAGPGRKSPHERAGNTLLNNKPHSTSDIHPGPAIGTPTDKPGKARAQSVPLFPSSSSLPQLDLRNPLMSPIRARSRSRSPDKYHGLKVHLSPPKLSISEQPKSPDTNREPRTFREIDHGPKGFPVNDADISMERADELGATVPEVCIEPPKSSATPVSATVPFTQLPVTPVPSGLSLSASMSPLTPLPETPLSLRTDVDEDRYTVQGGWSLGPERELETDLSVQTISQPNFGKVKDAPSTSKVSAIPSRSQIPRPSIGPPLQLPVKVDADRGHFKLNPKGSSTLSPGPTNAFTLLMKNSAKLGANKLHDKGKGKSESLMSRGASSNSANDAMKADRGKAGLETKKISLKDRMRRKEQKKPDAPSKFVPMVFDDDENLEVEAKPERQNTMLPIVTAEAKSHSQAVEEAQPETPTSFTLEGSQITRPSSIHELLPQLTTKSGDGLLQSQISLPISSTASLSESDPEGNRMAVSEDSTTPPALPMIVDHLICHGEEQATIVSVVREPAVFGKVSGPRSSPVTDHPVEQKVSEASQQLDKPVSRSSRTEVHSDQGTNTVTPKIVPKKRGYSNIPTPTRVTRSALKPPVPPPQKQMRRKRAQTVDSITRRNVTPAEGSAAETGPQGRTSGSTMKMSSPLRASSRNLRTPSSSPAKISLAKPLSKPNFSTDGSPSPAKIAKAISMFSHPTDVFAVDDIGLKLNSSLSTLSEALDKLKTPAPSRPNTSLGFNHDTGKDDEDDTVTIQQPSETTRRTSSSCEDHSVKHSFTADHGAGSSRTPVPTSARANLSTGKPRLFQKPMTEFFSRPGLLSSNATPSNNPRSAKNMLLGITKSSVIATSTRGKGKGLGGGGRIFPMTNKRLVQKASKKTSLPTVEASPVKGGESGGPSSAGVEDSISVDESLNMVDGEGLSPISKEGVTFGEIGDIFMTPTAKGDDEVQVVETSSAEKFRGKGKEKDKLRSRDSSRRASMALSQLAQSLSAGPAFGTGLKESMGPPSTPRKIARSASSSYPASSSAPTEASTTSAAVASTDTSIGSGASPDKEPGSGGTRFSARQAAKAASKAEVKSPSASVGPNSSGEKTSGEKERTVVKKSESLSILKDCTIFVDVRTDDGEEAGSLFVEMLESLGAKMQARVGQACTHVIFKNGVMSTISRYRLLRDPKPFVVGIAWVVECVEQRQRVEETSFLIDLNEMNIAGTNKRRRSMLPKLIGDFVPSTATDVEAEDVGDANVSMDGSTSSLTLDDDLTPLERARRRRSMIFGPPI